MMTMAEAMQRLDTFKRELSRVFVGQDEVVNGILTAFLAGGHVLIEGVPGLGKTLLAKALSRLVDCQFNRIQFTPDLMPSDITGSHVFNMKNNEFEFHPGPIFTNILLADEINRAPAKTHSALLQVMEELHVTVDGSTHSLALPFFTIATQNPIETEGTYALPEAQLDRFMLKLLIDYPREDHEADVLHRSLSETESPETVLSTLTPIITIAELNQYRQLLSTVRVDPSIIDYANAIVRATRQSGEIYHGASTRAGIALLRGSRVQALLAGREFVVPDDIMDIVAPVLRHRLTLTPEAEVAGRNTDLVLADVVRTVPVPRRPDDAQPVSEFAPTPSLNADDTDAAAH